MKIKDYRSLVAGIIGLLLFMACCFIILKNGLEITYIIGMLLAIIICITNVRRAIVGSAVRKEFNCNADERDDYIAMKSCQTTLKILNFIALLSVYSSLLLYVCTNMRVFILISITFAFVIIAILVIFICVNRYYEKHE